MAEKGVGQSTETLCGEVENCTVQVDCQQRYCKNILYKEWASASVGLIYLTSNNTDGIIAHGFNLLWGRTNAVSLNKLLKPLCMLQVYQGSWWNLQPQLEDLKYIFCSNEAKKIGIKKIKSNIDPRERERAPREIIAAWVSHLAASDPHCIFTCILSDLSWIWRG